MIATLSAVVGDSIHFPPRFETSLEVVQDEEREKEPSRSLFGNRFMSIFDPNFVRMSRDTLKTLCKDSRLA